MSDTPEELYYTNSHEWVRIENDAAYIGITDHAQQLLGDLVFVELPEIGQALTLGEEFAVVESVKAASDVYAPINGEVLEVNTLLDDAPETINTSPYVDGWLLKVRLEDPSQLNDLLRVDDYTELTAEEE